MTLRVYDIVCGSSCPRGASLQSLFPLRVMSHCLLVESNDGLVLIDTGVGASVAGNASAFLGGVNAFLFGIDHPNAQFVSAKQRIEQLGFQAEDVRHIIPTHLDFDHCGDLADFPQAQVHVFEQELARALAPNSRRDKKRYLPSLFEHEPQWSIHKEYTGDLWFGFETVHQPQGLPPEILMVPLFGHTAGHTGVAVDSSNGWVLHAGDAYYQRRHLFEPMSWSSQWVRNRIDESPQLSSKNQQRLAELIVREPSIRVFCSHDPAECGAAHT